MAKLTAGFSFTGPIDNITAYKMKGVDGIILRKKGGASKNRIKRSPDFANTRKLNAEFSGSSIAGKWLRLALGQQKLVADYNISGPINALMTIAQKQDSIHERGKRNVLLSTIPELLNGFSLNRGTPFDSIIRMPLTCSVSREGLSAHIDLPELRPGINFHSNEKHPFYRLVATLGIVPDFFSGGRRYQPSSRAYTEGATAIKTDWYPVLQGSPASTLDIRHTAVPPDQSFTLVLAIGICFGAVPAAGDVHQVKGAGAAKILTAI